MYVTYVTNRYGKATIESPKGPNVIFTGETSLKLKKNEFLVNKVNKQRFLKRCC